ncbi:TspO protein [Candidatus Woesebacteria bacterium RBG_13_36_22]|uniref:TspO protein n=1 Tax=Candidatus Woesebacteria bacterium RBG_13_36_22 TaxID=1802478 RepID=A0A1F7WZL7_9BACT|nr:MAG: TspO protein [Candidatus Woesebacteria bacterium RBG_13_36_22]
MKEILKITVFIVASEFAGIIGSVFTFSSIPTWYASLNKPVFSPPNWIFGPVWTILYALMGISAYLIWEKGIKNKEAISALKLFIIQLILNSLWSILFFGLHSPALAFFEIIILWVFIVLTVIRFYRLVKAAGYLLLPYLFWVTFASFLNLSIILLN